jgi:hypothetical protein
MQHIYSCCYISNCIFSTSYLYLQTLQKESDLCNERGLFLTTCLSVFASCLNLAVQERSESSRALVDELNSAVKYNTKLSHEKTELLRLKQKVFKSLQDYETAKSELTLQMHEAKSVAQRHSQRKGRLATSLNSMMKVKMKAYREALQKNSAYDAQRQVEEMHTKEQAEAIKRDEEKRKMKEGMTKCKESCDYILSGISVIGDALRAYKARPEISTQTEIREWKIEKEGQSSTSERSMHTLR